MPEEEIEYDEDDVIGVCSECHSDQDTRRLEKDIFLQAGEAAVCAYCGGVVILVERANRDNALRQASQQRGL